MINFHWKNKREFRAAEDAEELNRELGLGPFKKTSMTEDEMEFQIYDASFNNEFFSDYYDEF